MSSQKQSERKKRAIPLQSLLEGGVRLLSRTERSLHKGWRRLLRRPRTVTEAPNLLPTLIKVLAAFTQVDGEVLEEEIDSILDFLRYDYPEVVYSELRQLFRQALEEQQNLSEMALKLAGSLNNDRKILLGVQLYDLIFRTGMKADQVATYHDFMNKLGLDQQAMDIIYQLNANDELPTAESLNSSSQIEMLTFGDPDYYDVGLRDFPQEEFLLAYRYHDFIILKNKSQRSLIVQGRLLKPQEFCRIYPGQRLLVGEQVITSQDLIFYFNAKKNVSLPHLFVAINKEEVRLDKVRSRDSSLEVSFGLKVQVVALQPLAASLRGIELKRGTSIQAQLDDRILFKNGEELNLNDLKRRVRSFGGRFALKASKSEYLVSNNPGLLKENDILLSQGSGGEVLLKISCNYPERAGYVQVLQADRPIIVHELPVRNGAALIDGDTIGINPGQVLRCNFTDRIIEEERNIIHSLEMRDVICRFPNGDVALDNLTFSVERGEMICIMGASGCGKSTLLRALAGDFKPIQGEVLLNDQSLYSNHEALRQYITYIPQYEAFDEQLTIEENLSFAAALRAPHLSRRERWRRIDSKLEELGLNERRKNVVGDAHQKILSGGERKRLNIGLDMISTADIYLFDEPTSGLSSKDSEHVIDIIRSIAHNKIVLVTIHQPTAKIFHMFQKALLLDRGGKLIFFGKPTEMLSYFASAEHEQLFGTELGGCKACGATRPEFVFDVLETPLRDLSGDLIYQENNRGQLIPARRFSPDYWRDKFETYRLIQEVQQPAGSTRSLANKKEPSLALPLMAPQWEPQRWREEISQFFVLLQRSFISKLRNRANLLTTLVEAPVLAFLIGAVLRYSESSSYDFASAFHIPTYLFLSLVVAMFLGLTNSVDDIIHDRPVLLRERNLNVRLGYYLIAKVITLSLFAIVQCAFFTLIGNAMLSIRGFFWIEFIALLLTACSGISLGLLISSLVSEGKTAVNIIPVVLIPQIILGGALIKYEEMNRNLDFVYSIQEWFRHHPDSAMEPKSDLQVPLICEFMPMRWSYEALVYAQAKLNPLAIRQARIQQQINQLAAIKAPIPAQCDRLDDLKELLAILSGLSAQTAQEVDRRLVLIDKVIQGAPLNPNRLVSRQEGVNIEQLYTNQKIVDLISKAEMEQSDYRDQQHPNVFFGPVKYYFGLTIDLLTFNIGILLLSTLGALVVLYFILKHQIKKGEH
ncbi:MAG: ATP-binding cassette domain-containing protein [Chthoniobacterales bacterium]|nr:ATP-binding cassette domain-containing protein [Chthoniobacterales bacterium]